MAFFGFLTILTVRTNSGDRAMLFGALLMTFACGEIKKLDKKGTPTTATSQSQQKTSSKVETPVLEQKPVSKVAPPVFSPIGAIYSSTVNVSLASATAGAAIYFTTDGSDPTTSSTLYSSPIVVKTSTRIKAIAAIASEGTSEVKSEGYEIDLITTQAEILLDPVISSAGRPAAARLSQARSSITALTVGSKTLFAGGVVGRNASDVVDIYDASTNTWSIGKLSQPKARSDLQAVRVGSKAIFAGVSKVDIYDTSSNTWSTAALSQARRNLSVTSLGNKAIFAGGTALDDGTRPWGDSDVVDIYDASADSWSTAVLSRARVEISAISVGSKVILAGGKAKGNSDPQAERAVDIYDSSTGSWSQATLSLGYSSLHAVQVDTKALLVGYALDLYESNTNNWTRLTRPTDPDIRRPYNAATVVGGKALFAGTSGAGFLEQRYDIDVFDFSSSSWSKLRLPMYPFDFSESNGWVETAMTLGSKVIFARPQAEDRVRLVNIYDTDTQKWSTIRHDEPPGIGSDTMIGNGSKLFFAGGSDKGNLDTVYIYDLSTNQWN